MSPSVADHLKNPEVDVSAYVKGKRVALAHDIHDRTKVYLDTKYWALLRDVRLGRSKCESTTRLLHLLESRVSDRSLVCPLNADVYLEVMKQDDADTLMATAQLIDDLSLGVCMIPFMERIELEVVHFIESLLQAPDAIHSLSELVWTKTAYVLGFVTPDCYSMPDDVNIAMQKAFADHIWTQGLVDMLNIMGPEEAAAKKSHFDDISADLNAGKFANLDAHASFKSVFMSEIQGILDFHREEFSDLLHYLVTRDTGQHLSADEQEESASGQMLANLIYGAFQSNRITNQLATIRIWAGLHAALRWDRRRKYKPNDQFDLRHAIAAIPYCDVFLTERPLSHLVRDGNLKFDEHFKCKTVYRPSDALASVMSSAIP